MRRYGSNCGWLLLPVLLWNVAFADRLPAPFHVAEFWRDIPGKLAITENSLRWLVFALPFFIPLCRRNPAPRLAALCRCDPSLFRQLAGLDGRAAIGLGHQRPGLHGASPDARAVAGCTGAAWRRTVVGVASIVGGCIGPC